MQLPLFPPEMKTDWTPPGHLPDLADAKMIGLDVETCDPNLRTKGPGGVRKDGHLAGVSIATDDGFKAYLPIRHGMGPNMAARPVLAWLRRQLGRRNQPKVGANLLYDLEWLAVNDVPVEGPFWDVQVAEPLLDENLHSYSLESISRKHLGRGKEEQLLEEAALTYLGPKGDTKGDLWKLPAKYVGPYAEADAVLPLLIFEKQRKKLEEQGLMEVFNLETRLIPLLLAMRLRGVRVDVNRAEELVDHLTAKAANLHKELKSLAGREIGVWANDDLAYAFDQVGVSYPRTPKTGKGQFQKTWLQNHPAPIAKLVVDIRECEKMRDTFAVNQILNSHVDGRVYTQFHALRSDQYGTVSGRFSSSNPNLQQVPSRGAFAKMVRGLFVPEEGQQWWSADFSQIEFRLIVHYAALLELRGSDAACAMYSSDPKTDFHTMVATLTGLDRKPAKNINFGLAYNMGKKKLAASLGVDLGTAEGMFMQYHGKVPFVKLLNEKCVSQANRQGYVRTLAGRRRRFTQWEVNFNHPEYDRYKYDAPMEYGQALERYSDRRFVRRAKTHKAMNSVVQGTAADLMKYAMAEVWESGVCDVLGVPTLTVHDELDGSIEPTPQHTEALIELVQTMIHAVPLKVPVMVDCEIGPNWGDVSEPSENAPWMRGLKDGCTTKFQQE